MLKSLVTVLHSVSSVQEDEDTKESLGALNVNGEFELRCRLPQNYTMRVMNMQGSRIIATIVPREENKPVLYLTIAYNELYSEVERMNDLSAEEIEALKKTFMDMNDVTFSDAQTAAGTRLLIAKETGSDEDFVSIISLYKGYSVEFVLTPGIYTANRTLTDEQVQKGIDFLSNLNFISILRFKLN